MTNEKIIKVTLKKRFIQKQLSERTLNKHSQDVVKNGKPYNFGIW